MIYKGPELSTYWGDDKYKNRKATVMRNSHGYYVDMWESDQLVETRTLYEHSDLLVIQNHRRISMLVTTSKNLLRIQPVSRIPQTKITPKPQKNYYDISLEKNTGRHLKWLALA
jgi:hypothetical protein